MHREEGFTILESLVALAILSLALVTFYDVGRTSTRTTSHVDRVETAILLAYSKMDEIAATRGLIASRIQGQFAGTPYSWAISAIPLSGLSQNRDSVDLQDVTLSVTWLEGMNLQSVRVDTRHLGHGAP